MAKTINRPSVTTSSSVNDLRAKRETPSSAAPGAEPKASVVNEPAAPAAQFSFKDMIDAALGQVELPSFKRIIISAVVGLVVAGVATYGGLVLTNMLVTWALTMTTSAFIIFMTAFLGYAITLMAATMLGSKTQTLLLHGGLETVMSATRKRVTGLFGFGKNKKEEVPS